MKQFITDGTAQSFFTAVFNAYNCKECIISSSERVQLALDTEIVKVETDELKAQRVIKKLDLIDKYSIDEIGLLLRSCRDDKEQTAFEYIKLIVKHARPIRTMLNNPTVIEMTNIRSGVTGEIHRFKGFLRFMESDTGIFYAPFSPDNFIVDLLMPHFIARFKNQKFVIHDVKRKVACLYDGNSWIMRDAEKADLFLSAYEKVFEKLWKKYYNSVNIPERKNEKQMRGYMPVRYWNFLIEK